MRGGRTGQRFPGPGPGWVHLHGWVTVSSRNLNSQPLLSVEKGQERFRIHASPYLAGTIRTASAGRFP